MILRQPLIQRRRHQQDLIRLKPPERLPSTHNRTNDQTTPTAALLGHAPSADTAARTRHVTHRVELIDATAQTITLPAGSIDAVCVVNNVQPWQPLPVSLAHVLQLLRPGGSVAFGITEHAVLADGASAGRDFDTQLLPCLIEAGFTDLIAIWEPGGNGEELLVKGRRPPH